MGARGVQHVRGYHVHLARPHYERLAADLELELALQHSARLLLGVLVQGRLGVSVEIHVVHEEVLAEDRPGAHSRCELEVRQVLDAHMLRGGVGIGESIGVRPKVAACFLSHGAPSFLDPDDLPSHLGRIIPRRAMTPTSEDLARTGLERRAYPSNKYPPLFDLMRGFLGFWTLFLTEL